MQILKIIGLIVTVLIPFHWGVAQTDVLIATAAPISGQYSWWGEQYRQGTQQAVADLNAQGGVLGHKVNFIIGDDGCDADQAVAVAKSLVSQEVIFVAGHFCSGASIPASKVYEAEGVLMISPSSTHPQLTEEGGDNVFRVCGRDDQQGTVAGNYLADDWGDKKIAILHDGTAYGKGLADETKKQLNKRGIIEVLYQAYTPGESDYSPLMKQLQTQGVDVFYVGGYSTEAALVVCQERDYSSKMKLISGDVRATDEFWSIKGNAGEGALMTFFPDPRNNPEAATVVADFRQAGYEPEGYTLYAYAAVQIWAQAAEQAGSLELAALINTLRQQEFDTVLGKIRFDQKGDPSTPGFAWYVWKNGEYVLRP